MALVGNLRDFALHDFLSLVARGYKTGSLVLRRPDAAATLYFDRGKLISVVRPQGKERLGDMLVRTGKITPAQLQQALAVQATGNRLPIGQILVELGYIAAPVVDASVRQVIETTVYDLFTWHEGQFEFKAGEAPPPDQFQTPVPLLVENLIMEGVRRVDEMSRIVALIPSSGMIVRTAPHLREANGEEPRLSVEEWRVVARIDEQSTIDDLAQRMDVSSFEVSSVLYRLVRSGVVEVVPPAGKQGARSTSAGSAPLDAGKAAPGAVQRPTTDRLTDRTRGR